MNPGLIGGIVGSLFGLIGGLVGTYFSIKNTNGPRERTFMIKSAFVCWVAIAVFLALLFLLPSPYRWFLFVPYGILLPLGINYGNKTQQRIRREESSSESEAGR